MITNVVFSQKITTQEYINTYKQFAIDEMKRCGVPVAITLAQGVLETESGNSVLVKKSNNHFGIKCKETWTGDKVYHDDDESGECFRKYDSAYFSYKDHSDFLRTRKHYAFLFNLDPTDYRGWAFGLKKAGYATNPKYPQILIKTIEDYHLNDITIATLNEIPDYTVFNLTEEKSGVAIIDNSIKKIDEILEDPINTEIRTFNGLKATFAKSGTSLLAIATQFNIPLTNLLEYNDLIDDGLISGDQWIYLERKRTEGLQEIITVNERIPVYDFSQLMGVQLSFVLAYNELNENDVIKAGTTLKLKINAVVPPKKQPVKSLTHKVQAKENLNTIAKKYNVSVPELKKLNNLKTVYLKPGQTLIISK
jgi:LysM repeat protein